MKIFKAISLVLSVAFTSMSGHNSLAQDFDKGLAAYNSGDFATALREWRPLAQQGNVGAQFNLGMMYRNGSGVPQDYTLAVKWYRKAAEQGDAQAQFNLGVMYENGYGVPQDYAQAVEWYRKAAEQGYASAQFNLALSYYKGEGVIQDNVYAHMWVNIAASLGYERGPKARDIIAEKMTAEQIAEAQKLARECVKKNYKGC
jgi:TPR repeat protein